MRDNISDLNSSNTDGQNLGATNSGNTTTSSTFIDGSLGGDILVPNGTFLLDAEYSRVGNDLVLEGSDGQNVIIGDYFSQENAATLVNEAGAAIRGNVATQLAGPLAPGQYAQTGSTAQAESIGEFDKVTGEITVTGADGTVRVIASGDPVYAGDVLVTGADGALGIIFVDSSTMSMSENARIVIDEMIFNVEDYSGSQVFEIVQGAFMYTSGLVGKFDPDAITVNTPVATIGIRGTRYAVDVSDVGGETTVVIFEGAITVGNNAGQVLLDEVGLYTFVAGLNVPPTTPVLMPQHLVDTLMGRAILFHPVDQDLGQIDGLIDTLDNLETAAGGGSPPVLLSHNAFLQILGARLGGALGGSGPLGGGANNRLIDSNDDNDVNDSNAGFGTGGTGSGTGAGAIGGGLNQIYGTVNDDVGSGIIQSSTAHDAVYGLAGNDVIVGGHGEGNDFYYGGDLNGDSGDSDWVIYPSAADGVVVDLDVGQSDNPNYDHMGHATDLDPASSYIDTDQLYGIENIRGGDGNDIIEGDSAVNTLVGGRGNDFIAGGIGQDTIVGDNINGAIFNAEDDFTEAGDDTLFGGASGQVENLGGNVDIATALNVDNDFVTREDPDVELATKLPHVSIFSVGSGEFDFYKFTVSEEDSRGIFDIDYGIGEVGDVDTWIKIYDANGNEILSNDDRYDGDGFEGEGEYDLDNGSYSVYDSYLEFMFQTPGVYYISVGQWDPVEGQVPLTAGGSYELQISIENHSVPIDDSRVSEKIIGDHLVVDDPSYIIEEGEGASYSYANADASSAGNDTIFGGEERLATLIGDNDVTAIASASDDGEYSYSIDTGIGGDYYDEEEEYYSYANAYAYAYADAGDDIIIMGDNGGQAIGDSKVTARANADSNGGDPVAYSYADAEAGSDSIQGGAGNDTIIGDNLVTVSATATAYGYYDYKNAEAIVDTDIAAGEDVINGGDGYDAIIGDNKLVMSVFGDASDETAFASANAEAMAIVSAASDIIDGGDGGGTITGDNNILITATANSYSRGADLGIGADSYYFDDYYITVDGADDLLIGGSGSDTIVGDNIFAINASANVDPEDEKSSNIYATISVGAGDDTIFGGGSDDTIIGDNDVNLSFSSRYEDIYIDDFDAGNDTIYGGSGNDTIYGDNRNQNADPRDEYDILRYGGDDVIYGGSGNDVIYGGQGADWIVGGEDEGSITLAVDPKTTSDEGANPAGIVLVGFSSGDDIWGTVDGEIGSYRDQDVFVFRNGDGVDTIHDFQVGKDQLVISGYSQDQVTYIQDGYDTIITFGLDSKDAIKLVGVSTSLFDDNGNVATYDADDGAGNEAEIANGTLSADEIFDLQEDLFSDASGAPSAAQAAIVFVAAMEKLDVDDGGSGTDLT